MQMYAYSVNSRKENINTLNIHLDRKLYWTDWGLGTIERVNCDGTEREVVVTVDDEPWLNGLALDLFGEFCYFYAILPEQLRK